MNDLLLNFGKKAILAFIFLLFLPAILTAQSLSKEKIKKLTINGNQKILQSKILEILDISRDFFPDRYNPEMVRERLNRLRSYYLSQGFLEFEILSYRAEYDRKIKGVNLYISLFEGIQYRIQEIRIQGLSQKMKDEMKLEHKIREAVSYRPEQPFDQRIFYLNERKVFSVLAPMGYRNLKVATNYEIFGDKVILTLIINTGAQWFIHSLEILGSKNVKKSILFDELKIKLGDLHDPYKIQESINNLYQTGLFRSVRIREEILSGPGKATEAAAGIAYLKLYFILEESDYRSIGFGFGYDKYQELFGIIRWQTRNFLSRASLFRSEVSVSKVKKEVKFTYQERNFLIRDLILESRLFWSEEEILGTDLNEFSLNTVGLENTLLYPLGPYFKVTGGYDYHYYYNIYLNSDTETDDTDTSDSLNFEVLNENVYKLGFILSTRNDLFNPTRGVYSTIQLRISQKIDQPEYSFWQANYNLAYYQPLFWGFILAPNFILGRMYTFQNDNTPLIIDRFAQGEDFNLRGYEFRKFGPQNEANEYIGGDRFYFFSLELRFPVIFYTQLVLFVDAGNLFLQEWKNEPLLYTPGFGLRIQTPVGPLRLDIGFNPEKGYSLDSAVFSFGLGQAY